MMNEVYLKSKRRNYYVSKLTWLISRRSEGRKKTVVVQGSSNDRDDKDKQTVSTSCILEPLI